MKLPSLSLLRAALTFVLALSIASAFAQESKPKPEEPKEKPAPEVLAPSDIRVPKGFKVELVYIVPKDEQGSWVSLGTDGKGNLFASDQGDAGIYRITPGHDAKPAAGEKSLPLVEKVPVELSGVQGFVMKGDSLYMHANPRGLFVATDSDGDGMPDKLEELPGAGGTGGEHNNHAVIVTEDGKDLYVDAGNHTPLPEYSSSRVPTWDEDLLLPRHWDARGHARGRLAPGGWVCRFDTTTKTYEVYCVGFRNQYDIALNRYGDMFTYDADMEWDMGMPWYRPTRICQVVSGGDYGWRSGSGKWADYYEDSLPSVIDIGPGSPTGVLSGEGAKFPANYQDAIFALDWTFGTIYAIHLTPEGAGYSATKEVFAQGAPLPVTDAVIGDDGSMYFTIGGRRTQSALYRIRYTGKESTEPGPGKDTPEAKAARELRRQLEAYHGKEDKAAVDAAWPHLSSKDRFLRHAARVAIESQPADTWAKRVFDESNSQARITGAVALARSGEAKHQEALLNALLDLDAASLPEDEALGLLRAYALTFIRLGEAEGKVRERIIAELDPMLPAKSGDLNTELLRVLVALEAPSALEKGMALIANRGEPEIPDWTDIIRFNERYGSTIGAMLNNFPPSREIGYAFILRNATKGWTLQQRKDYISFLNEASKYSGGASFPGFLANMRADALSTCTDEERVALQDITGEDYNPKPDFEITPPEGPGQVWTVDSAMAAIGNLRKADFENGRNLYFAVSCGACHRYTGLGGGVGPDLTTVGNKFDTRYLLESIINPSDAISDQYGSHVVTLKDGTIHMGMVVEGDDRMEIYSSDPNSEPIVVKPDQVASVKESPVSQMPPGLINSLNAKELKDLIAYLSTVGDSSHRFFR